MKLKKYNHSLGDVSYFDGGSGEVVVIFHGWGSKKEHWKAVGEDLVNAGFRVIIPDLPGFGMSFIPPKDWGIFEYVDFGQEFLDSLNLVKYHLFGHSFGGRMNILLASRNLDPKNQGVILCSSAGIKERRFLKRVKKSIFFLIAKTGKLLLSIFPDSIRKRFQTMMYKLAREHDYEKANETMKHVFNNVVKVDLKKYLDKIFIRVGIIWGKDDLITPYGDAVLMKRLIPNSTLYTIDGARHGVQFTHKDEVVHHILSYLSQGE